MHVPTPGTWNAFHFRKRCKTFGYGNCANALPGEVARPDSEAAQAWSFHSLVMSCTKMFRISRFFQAYFFEGSMTLLPFFVMAQKEWAISLLVGQSLIASTTKVTHIMSSLALRPAMPRQALAALRIVTRRNNLGGWWFPCYQFYQCLWTNKQWTYI